MIIAMLLTVGLFSANFPLSSDTVGQYYPEVIFANNQYYAFWCDLRYYGTEAEYALVGTRISISGNVLDPNGKVLFKDQNGYEQAAASDGSNLLVVLRNFC